MWSPYLALKMLHILLAIIAVGLTSSFGLIMAGVAGKPDAVPHALRIIQRLEKVAGPSFFALLATGLIMGWVGNLKWTELWFIGSLGIMLVAMVLALGVARPTLAKQVALLDKTPLPVEDLKRLGARSRKVGMTLSLMSLTLITLMVFKPTW